MIFSVPREFPALDVEFGSSCAGGCLVWSIGLCWRASQTEVLISTGHDQDTGTHEFRMERHRHLKRWALLSRPSAAAGRLYFISDLHAALLVAVVYSECHRLNSWPTDALTAGQMQPQKMSARDANLALVPLLLRPGW